MTPCIDFARPAPQRRRRREIAFYRALAACAVIGTLPVLALAWHIDRQDADLRGAAAVLQDELHRLQPTLVQLERAESSIATLQTRLHDHAALAHRRAQAPALLDTLALARAPAPGLVHLAWRAQQAELRGLALDQDSVQTFIDRLRQAGLARVDLRELRVRNAARPREGYVFVLALPPVATGKAP